MVLCYVALYSECLQQLLLDWLLLYNIMACWCYCQSLLLWYVMLHCTLSVYSNCCYGGLLLCFAIQYYGMLVLLSILVTMVLCYVVLCSECLEQLLLEWLPYYSSHAIL